MRLMLYYSLHTTWNQLRRLFRTWLFLLLLCALLGGGLLGLGIARFSGNVQSMQAPSGEVLPEDFMEFFDASNLSAVDAVELGSGLLILSLLTMQVIGAEKSVSRLFLPADVNFLFASPLTPQEVLSFRLLTTLGTVIIASIYLFFQFPSLVTRFGITPFAAASILVTWCLALTFSILLKILTFEFGSRHPLFKANLRYVILVLLGILVFALYYSYDKSAERVFLLSAHRFFNASWTRWIPVWGWLKGIPAFALEGNYSAAGILSILSLALIAVMILVIRHIPVDYYEEASIRCEEIALYMQQVNSDQAGLLVMKPKHRSEHLERDGFHYGHGPSIYFFKTLYNRKRFGIFGFITRTMITYGFICLAGGLFVRMFMDDPSIYPPVFLLAIAVFFRTVASPMSEDIRKDSFTLIPENTWLKLFCSLLGGSVNCGLDAVLPLMIGSVAAGYSPLRGLLFLPFIISIDFFATAAGTFVDAAIPSSIDKSLKQVIQILLLYLGMIPDELLIAGGLISNHAVFGMSAAGILNLVLGLVFFGLSGVWLNPDRGIPARRSDYAPDRKQARAACSRIGVGLFGMLVLSTMLQQYLMKLLPLLRIDAVWASLLLYLPLCLIGVPFFLLAVNEMPAQPPARKAAGWKRILLLFSACIFLMYTGSMLGIGAQSALDPLRSLLPHFGASEASLSLSMPVQTLLAITAAPLIEEFVFRRCVIDRLLPYGEKPALITSALLFGLFHSSIQQVFYAVLLGFAFGYIYLKTGRLRYSIVLHCIINFMGSVITPAFVFLAALQMNDLPMHSASVLQLLSNPILLLFFCYIALLALLYLFGLVVTAYAVKEVRFPAEHIPLETVLTSGGILLFLVASVLILFLH